MKSRSLIVMSLLIVIAFCSAITYSIFNSDADLNSDDENIAKFIFNAEVLEHLEIPDIDLNPGENKEYLFSVNNNSFGNISQVSVEYQMTITTYHLIPLMIELYKLNGEEEELILTCDENYERNSQNELECVTPLEELGHASEEMDNYKLKVSFPSQYNDPLYSNLVDFIDIDINSWQKIED